ncbi:MAG: N-acetylmuramoyl-L-alanine amidase [Rhodospirillaceae bacterium]|nr:N-acetylmuramoyl-L-alanine amidase [Rhodospirillaceae bacterium]MBT5191800.1 N-acetylmuramoyl-L-alanine amidase [Rhodospirillaceae bacterium]MBT6427783.1 N-acetylmuramoyl-L-alanine amidase [Rhodospirillaceae bacterium]
MPSNIRILLILIVGLGCGLSSHAWAETIAQDIRVGIHRDKTRVVFDLSATVPYQIFVLADPYRIVVDLPEMQWQVPPAAARRKGGLIAGLRYGQYQAGNSRVVLDLKGPGIVGKSFFIPPSKSRGPRLVLDIRKSTRQAFLAAVRAPPKRVAESKAPPLSTKPKRQPTQKPLVVIDPGHGGIDPGAIGVSGIFEKRVTLGMAQQVRKAILALGRHRVRLTRDRDSFIPLRRRVAIARAAGAELFLSIHADSIANRRVRGGGIYTLSETASDKESAALAAKENRADLIAGLNLNGHDDEVTSILIDLTQRETMNYSAQFATELVPQLRQLIHMRRKPHRFAGFVVLKALDVPSVLIELGYLSNRKDEKMLTNQRSRAAIAKAIARAVDNYFKAQKS